MSDRVPEDMPDRMPEDLPDRMPEDMPEDMPDHMPEDMPDRMPNRMSEDMSDRMPEDLPVRKCINVMVGITRSKVIFLVSKTTSIFQLPNQRLPCHWCNQQIIADPYPWVAPKKATEFPVGKHVWHGCWRPWGAVRRRFLLLHKFQQ